MSDHLPECRRWFTDMPAPDECPACEMFRACEQRVLTEAGDRWVGGMAEEAIQRWRMEGVQAARDAVDRAYWKDSPTVQRGTAHGVTLALAAIDALRGQ